MEEILVAIDGSGESNEIVKSAIDLSKRTSLPVALVYVIKNGQEEPEAIREFERVERFHDAYANYLQDIGKKVTTKLKEVLEKQNIPCRTIVEIGNPADRILNVAETGDAKFIVVGLKGLHGINRIRSLGSVSRRVVDNAKCPVLVVPSP